MRRRPTSREGFSLVELMLTLAIVSVLAVMAVPRYAQALRRYELDLAARRVAQDLKLARDQSRLTEQSQTVTFSADTGRYILAGMSDPDRPEQTYSVDLGDSPYGVKLVQADFCGSPAVTFNGFGLPGSGGQVILSHSGSYRTVLLDGETGEASLP